MALTLAEKYRPKSIKQIVGNKEAISKFVSWLDSWVKGKIPSKKATFLYGPPGCGKTSLVYAAANDYNLELLELNASDRRDKATLERVIRSAANLSSLFGTQMKIILIDEVEGISGTEDRGGLNALATLIKETVVPIVLIANDAWNPRFSTLRNACLMIEFKKIPERTIIAVLRDICVKEGIIADPEALKRIAQLSEGDLRAAINDLDFLIRGKKSIKYQDTLILPRRNREIKIFDTINRIFRARAVRDAYDAVLNSEVDYEMLIRWISENIPNFLKLPEERYEALDKLVEATLFLNRARRTNYWRLLVYTFSLMSGGVAMSKKAEIRGFIKSSFPTWIRALSTMKANRALLMEIAGRIARRLHVSRAYAISEMLPYISILLENDKLAKKVIDYFEFSDEMVSFIQKRFS